MYVKKKIKLKMQLLNHLNKLKCPLHTRTLSKNVSFETKTLFENLSHQRSLLRVSGNKVYEFLQGLSTNDVFHLRKSSTDALFTMFLNKQGRVLYDALIYKIKNEESTVLIECDRAIQSQLKQHLTSFRIRKSISIDIADHELSVWACFQSKGDHNEDLKKSFCKFQNRKWDEQVLIYVDPRVSLLGLRIIAPSSFTIHNFQNIKQNLHCVLTDKLYNYIKHRYIYGISEGIFEIPTLQTFPFEVNCDYLKGISFHKGCYLGQEFTARTYHTGVIRKRIMPITIHCNNESKILCNSPVFNENGVLIGKIRGIQNEHAIGSLKVDQALCSKFLKVENYNASTHRPTWWPKDKC